ncbi:hypothetical protein FOCC_FOCC015667, partial [Frankliniella occidentalis]
MMSAGQLSYNAIPGARAGPVVSRELAPRARERGPAAWGGSRSRAVLWILLLRSVSPIRPPCRCGWDKDRQAIHLAGLPAICYVVMRFQDPKIMQKAVLAVALFYLSCIHLHRQIYDYGSYTLDITGPLMVITQKVTSLAFSLHDGLTQKEEDLSGIRKYHALRKMPTVLEYFAYMFHFQALMAGPIIFYRDYIEFIHGRNFLTHSGTSIKVDNANYAEKEVVLEPSPLLAVIRKVVASLVYAILLTKFVSVFPIRIIK